MPFRRLEPRAEAVIPWDGKRFVPGDPMRLAMFPGLAKWWRDAERVWTEYCNDKELSLLSQLDYMKKLTKQLPVSGYRVVYGGSSMYMAAAIVSGSGAVIEHQLYWALMKSLEEAKFLTAILNSDVVTMAVRRMQKKGEHNPRHVGKKMFKLPIPLYDPDDAAHGQLVVLAEHAERLAAAITLPVTRFELQRKHVRDVLERHGVAADINAIVKTLLYTAK